MLGLFSATFFRALLTHSGEIIGPSVFTWDQHNPYLACNISTITLTSKKEGICRDALINLLKKRNDI
jgi:hypothetical protein